MDFKEIKNTKHYLYDNVDEFRISHPEIPVRHYWRHGEEGEWVFTDDNFVCQILRKSKLKNESGKNTTYIQLDDSMAQLMIVIKKASTLRGFRRK